MLPGDIIKAILKPAVKGTRFEGCEACERRRKRINKWWTTVIDWFTNILTPWKT